MSRTGSVSGAMIEIGKVVTTVGARRPVRVDRLIGEGGQGAVFRATPLSGGSEPIALKWYYAHTATADQRRMIEDLVERGAPTDRFLWPIDLVTGAKDPGFGYVMPLRPDRYRSLADMLTGNVDVGFSVVTRLSLGLAHSFLELHSEGLCYRDISFGNVFFDPDDGAPLICDNDNVTVDGRGPVTVLGTRRFMAPEIVRREAVPSSATDLFSLGVLLFYILMSGHPLVGRREAEFVCWDERAESELFGQAPLFVFDPSDPSNAPDVRLHGGVLRSWGIYPTFIRSLFVKAFTTGLTDPRNGRVRESVWRAACAQMLDMIGRCAACQKENFFEPGVAARHCWFCDRPLDRPTTMHVRQHRITVSDGAVVTRHHFHDDYDVFTVLGRVVSHPSRADILGLRNESSTDWRGGPADGSIHLVGGGRSIRLQPGTRVEFGPDVVGTVE